jgi:hypothetical protein
MKSIRILAVALLVTLSWAAQTTTLYDNFKGKLLDPSK